MTEILVIAFLLTLVTVAVVYAMLGAGLAIAYIADNWDDFSDLFKFLGFMGLVFAMWVLFVGSYKLCHPAQKAEVEDVRAS